MLGTGITRINETGDSEQKGFTDRISAKSHACYRRKAQDAREQTRESSPSLGPHFTLHGQVKEPLTTSLSTSLLLRLVPVWLGLARLHSFCSFLFFSGSTMFDSLKPHGLQHARLPWPSLSPGVCSNSCPLSLWCYPTIPSSAVPSSFCLQNILTEYILEIFPRHYIWIYLILLHCCLVY